MVDGFLQNLRRALRYQFAQTACSQYAQYRATRPKTENPETFIKFRPRCRQYPELSRRSLRIRHQFTLVRGIRAKRTDEKTGGSAEKRAHTIPHKLRLAFLCRNTQPRRLKQLGKVF